MKKQSNPWAAIDALIKTDPEPTGPEWFTTEQFARRYGMTVSGASPKLKKMAETGSLHKWRGVSASTHRVTNKWSVKKSVKKEAA